MWVGVVLGVSAAFCACLWVRPGGVGGGGGGVGVGVGGLSTVMRREERRGGGRWKSEQNNLAQWESRVENTVVKETVIRPSLARTHNPLRFPRGKKEIDRILHFELGGKFSEAEERGAEPGWSNYHR